MADANLREMAEAYARREPQYYAVRLEASLWGLKIAAEEARDIAVRRGHPLLGSEIQSIIPKDSPTMCKEATGQSD